MSSPKPTYQIHSDSFSLFDEAFADLMSTDSILLDDINETIEDIDSPSNTAQAIVAEYHVQDSDIGERVDKIAAKAFAQFSREQLKTWLDTGELTINGHTEKPKYRLKKQDVLILNATPAHQQDDLPEAIELDIVYEDEAVLVINKPVGMVVHPGAGNWTGTLVNALLYHYPDNRTLPRAGLVHRIDKETSGLMVIAKDSQSQLHLINQLKDKSVYRHYLALVYGNKTELAKHRTIDAPIGRHPTQRTKMAVVGTGKPAVTHLEKITQLFEGISLVDVSLETGRTHQIRVHLSHLGFSLIGDPVYGSARQQQIAIRHMTEEQANLLKNFNHQALHAYELGFIHPKTGKAIKVKAEPPADMQQLIEALT